MVAIYTANRLPPLAPKAEKVPGNEDSDRAGPGTRAQVHKTAPGTKEKLLTILTRAAENGDVCPMSADLCGQLGIYSLSRIPALLNQLADDGLITVVRYQTARKVTIIATGKSTKEPDDRTIHWRDRT